MILCSVSTTFGIVNESQKAATLNFLKTLGIDLVVLVFSFLISDIEKIGCDDVCLSDASKSITQDTCLDEDINKPPSITCDANHVTGM
jgi:hypothetical protein